MNDVEAERDPVEQLAEEFARRLRRGERPSLSEYTARHPELAAEIADLFPALVVMEQFGSVADPAAAPSRAPAPPRLGDFRIIREVGRGGMGVVYEAVQESLGRHVALKVLPASGPGGAGASRERFRREAKAAAKLHHTHIVPVFAVGEDGNTLYYAMQFIRGQGLDTVLAEVRRLRAADGTTVLAAGRTSGIARRLLSGQFDLAEGPATPRPELSSGAVEVAPFEAPGRDITPSSSGDLAAQPEARYCREVARLGVQAAEALHYAHQQGVLHRDVKPSNLLLDAAGTLWVTDFGLAKASDSDDLTGTGDLIGTLRYMAPERFKGRTDPRSDVYSLAVTLYEVLTLRPAFDDSDRLRVIDRIGREDPPRLRAIATEVPRDLETVVHKALARSPADRYATAQDFADDLQRYLDGRPVRARRHGWAEQTWRWGRRNPAVAGLTAAVAVLLLAVAVVSTVAALRLGTALTQANDNLTRAVSAEVDADTNRWRTHLLDARASRLSRAQGQRFAALANLRRAVTIARDRGMPAERFGEMRTEAIAALALPDLYVEHWWDGQSAGARAMSLSGDLETYAQVDEDGTVCVRRVADDAELHRLPAFSGPHTLDLGPDGRSLLQYQSVTPFCRRLWDLSGDSPALRLEESDHGYHSYRPDGRQIALVHRDGTICVYEPATGRRVHRLPPETVVTDAWIDLHPSAPLVAVSSYHHRDVLVRDLHTGAVVARAIPPWRGGGWVRWHPSGQTLCVGQGDGDEIRVYDFHTAAPGLTYRRSLNSKSKGGTSISFNGAGDRAAINGWGATLRLIDFTTGRSLFETPAALTSLQFDASGRRLSTALQLQEGKVGFWSVADGRECRTLLQGRPPYSLRAPVVSPDGRLLAVNILAEGLVVFDLASDRELATIPFRVGPVGRTGSFLFEPSGALLTNSWDGCFRWPLRADPSSPGRLLLGPPERLSFHDGDGTLASSRDGRILAQSMYNGYGMQTHAGGWILHPDRSGAPRRVMAGDSGADAAVSPDGRWVAFGVHGSHVRVFEAATDREVWRSPPGSHRCWFTPDGRWLATDADGGRCYAVGTWEPGPRLGPGWLNCVSADGRLAVMSHAEGYFRLVEVGTGRELARLEDPDRDLGLAALTPDGSRLVANTRDGLRVWDLRAIRRELTVLGLDLDAPSLPPEPAGVAVEVQVVGAALLDREVRAWHMLVDSSLRLLAAPADLVVRRHRAEAAEKIRWPWLAEWDYGRLLDRRPDDRLVRMRRGMIRLRAGRSAEALADFDDLVARNPADHAAGYRRAQALAGLGRFSEAAEALGPVMARFPKDPDLPALRGLCRERAEDAAGAAADFQRMRDMFPDPAAADNHLAWVLVTGPQSLRDPDRAVQLARSAVARTAGARTHHNTLGVALCRAGAFAEAVTYLAESLAYNAAGTAAWDLYFLAQCHHRLGDLPAARDCLDRAVQWQRQKTGLTPRQVEELDAFRAEAAAVLAGR